MGQCGIRTVKKEKERNVEDIRRLGLTFGGKV